MRQIPLLSVILSASLQTASFSEPMGKVENEKGSWNDLDQTKNQLETKLQSLTNGHVLNATDATNLRNQLNAIEDAESRIRQTRNYPTLVQYISFDSDLKNMVDSIDMQLERGLETSAQIDARLSQLTDEVEQMKRKGEINDQDTLALKSGLADVAEVEKAFKSTTAADLNTSQIQTLAKQLDKVQTTLSQDRLGAKNKPIVDNRQQYLQHKIDKAQSSGQLKPTDAQTFKQALTQIAVLESSLQSSAGGMTEREILLLAGELDDLNTKIDEQIKSTALSNSH